MHELVGLTWHLKNENFPKVFYEIHDKSSSSLPPKRQSSDWLTYLVYQLEPSFLKQETTWIHVLNQISEQTDFRNIWSFPRNIFYINLQCTVSLQWSSIAAWVNSVFSARQVKVFPWSEGLGTKCKRDLVILPPSKIWKYWGKIIWTSRCI